MTTERQLAKKTRILLQAGPGLNPTFVNQALADLDTADEEIKQLRTELQNIAAQINAKVDPDEVYDVLDRVASIVTKALE